MVKSKHPTFGSLMRRLKETLCKFHAAEDAYCDSIRMYNEECLRHERTKQAMNALVKHHVDKESAELEHSLLNLVTYGQVGVQIVHDECCRGQVFGFHIRTAELRQMSTAYRAEYLEESVKVASRQLADLITKHFMAEMKIKTKEIDGIDSRFRY